MKIIDVSKIQNVYDVKPAAGRPVKKTAAARGTDKLMLSRDAIDFQAVMKGLKDAPDIRADKVAEISVKYAGGDYRTEARDTANALLRSGLFTRKTQ